MRWPLAVFTLFCLFIPAYSISICDGEIELRPANVRGTAGDCEIFKVDPQNPTRVVLTNRKTPGAKCDHLFELQLLADALEDPRTGDSFCTAARAAGTPQDVLQVVNIVNLINDPSNLAFIPDGLNTKKRDIVESFVAQIDFSTRVVPKKKGGGAASASVTKKEAELSLAAIDLLEKKENQIKARATSIDDEVGTLVTQNAPNVRGLIDQFFAYIDAQKKKVQAILDANTSCDSGSTSGQVVRRQVGGKGRGTSPAKGAACPLKGKPGTTKPGTTNPGTTKPGTTNPGTTKPGTTKPGTTKPGAGRPATTRPGATKPPGRNTGSPRPATKPPAKKPAARPNKAASRPSGSRSRARPRRLQA